MALYILRALYVNVTCAVVKHASGLAGNKSLGASISPLLECFYNFPVWFVTEKKKKSVVKTFNCFLGKERAKEHKKKAHDTH